MTSKGRKMHFCLALGVLLSFCPAAKITPQETAPPSAEVKMTFDTGFDSLVPAKRSTSGEILVQPMINDQEAGWFRLDPAVEGMRISAALAQALSMTRAGTIRLITSSQAMAERPVWTGVRFQLGPLVAEGLEFAEMDEPSSSSEEDTVEGVVGTALLQAAVVELDVDSGKVRLFDPAGYDAGEAIWQEFSLEGGLPAFTCRFEGDREAKFGLDLRSPLGILFFSEAVVALELLKDRASQPVKVSGATFSRASAQTGSLEWFEAAGLRLETPQAVFLAGPTGLSIEKSLAGLLGREVLKGCVLVMDYAPKKLLIQKKAEGF